MNRLKAALPYIAYVAIGFASSLSVYLFILLYDLISHLKTIAIHENPLLILAIIPAALLSSFLIEMKFSNIKRHIGGTELVIYSYFKSEGLLKLRDAVSRAVASAITIGSGGSAGMEAPSFLLGGGVGSFIGSYLSRFNVKRKELLIAGSSGGLTAILGTPLTSAIYSCEVLYRRGIEWRSFPAALVSSLTSYLASAYLFHIPWIPKLWSAASISMTYIAHSFIIPLLVVPFSLFFIGFMRILRISNEVFSRKFEQNYRYVFLIASAVVGVILGYSYNYFPEALGEGKEAIVKILSGSSDLSTSPILLASLKIIFVSLTLNFGGSGGLFVPQVVAGALLGAYYSHLTGISTSVAALVAISAMLSATSKTPIAAVAYSAEIGGFAMAVPSFISSSIAYLATLYTSIYVVQPRNKKSVMTDLKSEAF